MAEAKIFPDPFVWAIEPARHTFPILENTFSNPANDQHTQDDQPVGPEPTCPPEGALETDGRGMPGAAP